MLFTVRPTRQAASNVFQKGLKKCPNSIPLWLSAAHLEEQMNGPSRARATLAQARTKNPKNADLWLATVRLEARVGKAEAVGEGAMKSAEANMARALQECPTSGTLWAEYIMMVPKPQRRAKSVEALKRCDHDPYVIAAVSHLFWADRKIENARKWFTRAITLAPDIGDLWASFYKFELQHGVEEQQTELVKKCVETEPKHGEQWTRVVKAVENAHLGTEAILKKVAAHMGKEEEKGAAA